MVEFMLLLFAFLGTFGTLIISMTVMSIVFGVNKDSKKYDEPDGSVYVQKNGRARLD